MTKATDADREAVTKADAIKFLKSAVRNWNHVPRLSGDDIEDVRKGLDLFAARHREASTAALTAENERLPAALKDVEPLLSALAIPARADQRVSGEVADLGRRIGYGNLMTTASAKWRASLEGQGIAGGEFSPNICQITAENAWMRVCAVLNGSAR